MSNSLVTIRDLDSVVGGNPGFNPGQCFDSIWPWAGSGATAGKKGAASGAAAGFLTSPACGNGVVGPSTLLRQGIQHAASRFWQAPAGPTPYEKGRFGNLFGK
jgi:hypothetical protein